MTNGTNETNSTVNPIDTNDPNSRFVQVSLLGTLPVVMFHNRSTHHTSCVVCASYDAVDKTLNSLRGMSHITDIKVIHAPVKR